MDHVKSVILSLQLEVTLLKAEISLLELENRSLCEANKVLGEENPRLKERLGLTFKNSSIPSSKELYKLKREQVKSTRNKGGQPGHAFTTRSKLASDEIIELPISDSCSCGSRVAISSKPYVDQKIDLPDIKPHVIYIFCTRTVYDGC